MAKKLYTRTLQIKVHAPKRMSAHHVAGIVDTIIAAGLSDAEASAELNDEDQMNDPDEALSLRIEDCKVVSIQKRKNGPHNGRSNTR